MCAMWVILSVCRVGGGALRRQPHQSHHQATRVYCEAHYIALNRLPPEQWEAPGPRSRAWGWLGLIWRPRGSCSPGPVTTRLSSAAAKLHSPLLLSSHPRQAHTVEGTLLNEGTKILSSSQKSYPAPVLSTSGVSCFISFSWVFLDFFFCFSIWVGLVEWFGWSSCEVMFIFTSWFMINYCLVMSTQSTPQFIISVCDLVLIWWEIRRS